MAAVGSMFDGNEMVNVYKTSKMDSIPMIITFIISFFGNINVNCKKNNVFPKTSDWALSLELF